MSGVTVSQRDLNAYKINAYSLYTKPCRGGSAWISGIIVAYNFVACILCSWILALNFSGTQSNDTPYGYDSFDLPRWRAAAAFNIIIILGLFVVSIVDALHRYHRTISAKRVVITGSAAIMALAVWTVMGSTVAGDATFVFDVVVLAPSGILFYALSLSFGAIALRRERKGWKGASKPHVEALNKDRVAELNKTATTVELGPV